MGCDHCRSGRLLITTCPADAAGDEVLQLLSFADDAANGAWPHAGGLLDQSRLFLDVARIARAECDAFLHPTPKPSDTWPRRPE